MRLLRVPPWASAREQPPAGPHFQIFPIDEAALTAPQRNAIRLGNGVHPIGKALLPAILLVRATPGITVDCAHNFCY